MPIFATFILFQLLIIIPFTAGIVMKKFFSDPSMVSKRTIALNLTVLEPPVILWTIWGLTISRNLVFLPAAGLAIVVSGLAAGIAAASLLRLEGASKKTFLISASLANHGFTMGGFICYIFMKETGLGLSSIFITYFIPYTFLIIFSYARSDPRTISLQGMRKLLSGYQNVPLYAALIAVVLLLAGVPRPALHPPVQPLIMASVALYYWTLGLTARLSDIRILQREQVALGVIKFLFIPALTFLLVLLAPLDNDIRSVIRIQSFMPAAVYSVVTAVLFDLDARLASSLFIVNTVLFIIVVLPVMAVLHQAGAW